jgi:Spy/CpxP family protein refolding chaperone
MKKAIVSLTVMAGLAASVLFAQTSNTRPGPPTPDEIAQRRVNFLTTLLTLTTAQQQQALTIFTNAATTESGIRTSLQAARQSMNTAVQNNDINSINQISNTIGTLTAQSTVAQSTADAAFYQILTPDQRTKLAQVQTQGPGPFGGGPGGPGPRGFRGGH